MGRRRQPWVPVLTLVSGCGRDRPASAEAASSSIERPTRAESFRKFGKVGQLTPFTQSETHGCETPRSRARAACEVPEVISQFRSASITPRISGPYSKSIGGAYGPLVHASGMKKKRTVWARIEEVLIENKEPATQKHGAGLVGLKQPSAALWNKPGKYPEMEIAVRLADKLGVCVQWLLNEDGPKRLPPENEPHLDALYLVWPGLTDVAKRDVVGFARGLAEIARQSAQQPTEVGDERKVVNTARAGAGR